MQIRLPPDLDACAGSLREPMTVGELLARFPEAPRDLADEPVLREYVRAFGPLLRVARKPSPCMRDGGDHQHVFYTRLLNDLAAETPASGSRLEGSKVPGSRRKGKEMDNGSGSMVDGRRPASPPSTVTHQPSTIRAQRETAPTRFIVVDGSNLLGRLPGFELNSAASRDRHRAARPKYHTTRWSAPPGYPNPLSSCAACCG